MIKYVDLAVDIEYDQYGDHLKLSIPREADYANTEQLKIYHQQRRSKLISTIENIYETASEERLGLEIEITKKGKSVAILSMKKNVERVTLCLPTGRSDVYDVIYVTPRTEHFPSIHVLIIFLKLIKEPDAKKIKLDFLHWSTGEYNVWDSDNKRIDNNIDIDNHRRSALVGGGQQGGVSATVLASGVLAIATVMLGFVPR